MMKRQLSVLIVAAVAATGCFKTSSSVTPTSTSGLNGTWSSVESLPGAGGSWQTACTNFTWAVTEYTGTTGAGTFGALCFGNVQVTGSARGTLSGSTLNWSANATGTVPGGTSCAIALTGTAVLESDRIRIPYSGTTCLGPVSGTETIKK